MRIRPIEPRDYEGINAIQKRYPEMWDGLPYHNVTVDFTSPDNLLVLVAEEDDGTFIACVGAIRRSEIWATMDRNAYSPAFYVKVLRRLMAKMIVQMVRSGYQAGFSLVPVKLKSWSNMLYRRFKFERVGGQEVLWFNAKKATDRARAAYADGVTAGSAENHQTEPTKGRRQS